MQSTIRNLINAIRGGRRLRPYFSRRWYLATYGNSQIFRWFPRTYQLVRGWQRGLSPHPLFDVSWYLAQNPDVAAAGIEPLAHYAGTGWKESRQPHPLFDVSWYLAQNPDVAAAGIEPLAHYIRVGWKESRQPHPLFDVAWYLAQNPDVSSAGWEPLRHYLTRGWREGRRPHPIFDSARYLVANPDVADAGIEPLAHYLTTGWRERREPHPLFDGSWYLEENPDIAGAGSEPLRHYLTQGWREGRRPHPIFDPARYLAANPDVAAAGIEPLGHYLTTGWLEGRQPHALFDGRWYLEQNRDVALAGIEPLTHFVTMGWTEQRDPSPLFSLAAYAAKNPAPIGSKINPLIHFLATKTGLAHFGDVWIKVLAASYCRANGGDAGIDEEDDAETGPEAEVRAIAMYLPQFHPIPENDRWWGKGFTEWTNVRRGRPMYEGHHQPHVPHDDIGHYNLLDEGVLERQAAMAKQYGIHGFCFYYYWFAGRRVLEKPLDRMLRSGKPGFPFCLCWANENWTKTWDGRDHEILLKQEYSQDDDIRFITELLPALRDPRYIRIEGRPLLIVYRPGLLGNPRATAARWRAVCRDEGLGEIHLAAVHSFDRSDPRDYGFDSAIQFPPLQIPAPNRAGAPEVAAVPEFRGGALDYRDAIAHSLGATAAGYTLFRGVMPGWDNTARRMERATVWINSSPELYGRWLRAAAEQTRRELPAGRRYIFINAWNEWAEGAHLEPDKRHGYRFLEETAVALCAGASAVHGNTLTARPGRHAAVYRQRWNRLRVLFGDDPSRATHGFLADHVALLAQVHAAGCELLVDAGEPACRIGGNTVALHDRRALAGLHQALRGAAGRRQFCFVLLQYNKPEVTARCVDSLRRLKRHGQQVRIVVVDNQSRPEAIERTRELFGAIPEVALVFNDENLGFARGNNVGYAFARRRLDAEFIVALNNDAVIEDEDFIAKCLKLYDEWSYSILGPDVVTPDGRRENPWNDYVYEASGWRDLNALYRNQRETYLATGKAEFRKIGSSSPGAPFIMNPLLQGAALIVSPIFVRDRERLFDERTFLYGEEFLLATACLLRGHCTLYSSELRIAHEEGVSTGLLQDAQKMMYGYDNSILASEISRACLERQAAATKGKPIAAAAPELDALLADGGRHVLVDLLFCQPGFHGGGEYGKAVFKALVESTARRGDAQLWAALDPNLFIDDWVLEACRQFAVHVIAVQSFGEIVELVNSDRFTSFFAPAIVIYTGYEYMKTVGGPVQFTCTRTKIIGTLLDIRDFELALDWQSIAAARRRAGCRREQALSADQWAAEAAHQRDQAAALRAMYKGICSCPAIARLVTISQYSAASIRRHIADIGPKLEVLYAPEKDRAPPQPFASALIDFGPEPFALVMNAAREEKNAASVVAAFDALFSQPAFAAAHPRLKVALTGIDSIDDLGLQPVAHGERFVAFPHLPAGHLEFLLREAAFLVYASFNEGFGYPPLEAMTHGTPSIIAGNTAVPEICGEAAVRCDPFDIESIIGAITTILSGPPDPALLRFQLAAVGARQAADLQRIVRQICCRDEAAASRPLAVEEANQ